MKQAIKVQGPDAQARFWIRVFELEEEIAHVQARLNEPKPPGEIASVPIVAEYSIDNSLKFYYVLMFKVDRLGANDVIGMIYFGDEPEWETLNRHRDEFAETVLETVAEKRPWSEVSVIESRKQV